MAKEFRSTDLAELLSAEIFDAEDAAKFLGLARNSLEYAAYRRRIPFVHYGSKKWFTRADLIDYRDLRGRGKQSLLEQTEPLVVRAGSRGTSRAR